MELLKILSRLERKRIFSKFQAGKSKIFGIFIYLFSLWGMLFLGGFFPMFIVAGRTATLSDAQKDLPFSEILSAAEMLSVVDLVLLLLFVLMALGTFFQFRDLFFHSFDENTLWALPIPKESFILAKFSGSWMTEVPMILAFSVGSLVLCYLATESLFKVFLLLLSFLLTTILGEAVGGFLRIAFSRISSGREMPKFVKSLIAVAIFATFMILYYYEIAQEFRHIAEFSAFYNNLPGPFHLFSYMLSAHIWVFIPYALLAIGIFYLFLTYMGKHFFEIAERLEKKGATKVIGEDAFSPRSKRSALLRKEISLYWSNTAVAMNTFFGILVPIILSLLLFVPSLREAFLYFIESQSLLPRDAFIFLAAMGFGGMMNISTFFFSLEGKNAYNTYALPLSGREIFLTKLAAGLVLSLPSLLLSIVLVIIALQPAAAYWPFLLLAPLAYACLSNGFGLFFDWKFANYNWENPQELAKNSKQSFFSFFGSLFVTFVMIFLGVEIMGAFPLLYAGILTAILVLADVIPFLLLWDIRIYEQ